MANFADGTIITVAVISLVVGFARLLGFMENIFKKGESDE